MQMKPGKKGISLSKEQAESLKENMDALSAALSEQRELSVVLGPKQVCYNTERSDQRLIFAAISAPERQPPCTWKLKIVPKYKFRCHLTRLVYGLLITSLVIFSDWHNGLCLACRELYVTHICGSSSL